MNYNRLRAGSCWCLHFGAFIAAAVRFDSFEGEPARVLVYLSTDSRIIASDGCSSIAFAVFVMELSEGGKFSTNNCFCSARYLLELLINWHVLAAMLLQSTYCVGKAKYVKGVEKKKKSAIG
jgi:hypothetical protein